MEIEAIEIVMHLDNFSFIYFFIACNAFIILQGLQLTFKRLSKEMFSIKLIIGISFLIHPLSIFFFGGNESRINPNIPLRDFNESVIFFDIFALMLLCIMLSYPSGKNLWQRVLVALMPLPLFLLIAHISFSEGATIRELNILLSFSFIIILGCIIYQCTYFSQRGLVSGRFFKNFNFLLVIAITVWLIWAVSQINDELYSVTYSELFFAWLVIKTILLELVFQFNYVVDESRRITNRDNLIKELKITLAENSVMKTVLYNFPLFFF